jgi:signal transduction histidine kinase
MAEHKQLLAGIDKARYSGKLWSSSPIAQEILLLLAELASEVSTAMNFEALQRILSRKLRWILDFDRCSLAVRSESISSRPALEYLLFEITSPSRAKDIPPQKIPIDKGWPGKVLIESKPHFIENLDQLPPLIMSPLNADWGIAPKARSLMLLPLRIGERTIGSLNFSSNTAGAYSIAWRNLASLLASQVGGQLGSILTQEKLKSAYEFHERAKVAEAANLALEYEVQERTLQIQQALDFEARLKRITDKVRDSLDESQIVQAAVMELAIGLSVGCCNMAFYNLDQGTSTICYEYATFIPASQGRIAQMADFSELYCQLLQNQYFQFCSIIPHPIRGRVAMLACPIFDDQGILGDLWLINQQDHAFNELEIRLVQQVANQCAIAIRQARLYQAATAQVEELEQLNSLKDDFLSTVSHELRTPLSNMKMAIQMLKIAPTTERRERYLEILQNECVREISLINTLLDLQQLEATSYSISHEIVSLQEWLPAIIEPFQLRTQESQQTLRVDLPPTLLPIISDTTNLGRILVELLNNACKYTPAGGEIVLEVGGRSQGSGVREREEENSTSSSPDPRSPLPGPSTLFSIRNSAEIPATELPRIFEKFYRVPNADPWKQGGTGLGLALVQKLVTKMEGTIQVKSSHGWTTFTVQLAAPVAVIK